MCCRAENGRLRSQNEQLRIKVDETTCQCRELTGRLTQQSHVHEKMRHRLHEMDSDAQRSSQQVPPPQTVGGVVQR